MLLLAWNHSPYSRKRRTKMHAALLHNNLYRICRLIASRVFNRLVWGPEEPPSEGCCITWVNQSVSSRLAYSDLWSRSGTWMTANTTLVWPFEWQCYMCVSLHCYLYFSALQVACPSLSVLKVTQTTSNAEIKITGNAEKLQCCMRHTPLTERKDTHIAMHWRTISNAGTHIQLPYVAMQGPTYNYRM